MQTKRKSEIYSGVEHTHNQVYKAIEYPSEYLLIAQVYSCLTLFNNQADLISKFSTRDQSTLVPSAYIHTGEN